MKFRNNSRSSLLALSLISLILVQITQGALTAGSLFELIPSGNPGSCSSSQYDLDTMVQEAATLAQNSINAINTLLAGNAKPTKQNANLFQMAAELWGATYSRAGFGVFGNYNLDGNSKSTLQQAQGYYKQVLQKLQSGQVDGAKMVCSAKDFKYVVKLGDLGQTPADQLISQSLGDDPNQNPGYYWTNYFRFLVPDDFVKTSGGSLGGDLCDDTTTDGETWASQKFLMMCDRAFQQGGRSLASLIAGQKSMQPGTDLDSLQTVGGVFLHEMMHWINQAIRDVQVVEVGGARAYGFALAAGIANQESYGPGVAVKNADNYRVFAFLVTLNQIQWEDGKVQSYIGQ